MRTVAIERENRFKGPQPRRSLSSIRMETRTSPRNARRELPIKYGSCEELHEFDDIAEDVPETDYGWHNEYLPSEEDSPASSHNSPDRKSPNTKNTYMKSNFPQKDTRSPRKRDLQEANELNKFAIIFLVAVLGVSVCLFTLQSAETLPPLTREELTQEIFSINKEFPSQPDNTWTEFSSGIKKVEENPSHPSVFLLLHEADEKTPMCLAQRIAKLAMRFLNATNNELLVLEGEELGKNRTLLDDYGELINDKHHQVIEHRTMIVKNLHKIPAEIARSFHTFCDVQTPLVDKAVYLFTLKASGAERNADKPTMLAEKVLTQIWGKQLKTDILMPLIVRITDTVIIVKPENMLSTCQL
ncbi:hypothetical protein C0J52_11952 [Blattella germanica]|nr:hypothetical protein C0J52_11952 [Blattella germanica]